MAEPPASAAFLYDSAGHDREVPLAGDLAEALGDEALLWLDLLRGDAPALDRAGAAFALDPGSIAALAAAEPDPGVDNYGCYSQFAVGLAGGKAEAQRIDFIVGENWLVTVRDGDVPFFRHFRDKDKAETQTGRLTAQAFAATLLDWLLEEFFAAVAKVETAVDRLDDEILADPGARDLLPRLLAHKRRIADLRRQLLGQRRVFYGLARPDILAQSDHPEDSGLTQLAARFERAHDEVERARDLVLASFDLLASRLGQSTNELVKALTFFTVVIGTIAAAAGLFGMNFDTPFFHTGAAGFYAVAGTLAALGAVSLVLARWRKWV